MLSSYSALKMSILPLGKTCQLNINTVPLAVAQVPGWGQAQTDDQKLVFLSPFTDPELRPGSRFLSLYLPHSVRAPAISNIVILGNSIAGGAQ